MPWWLYVLVTILTFPVIGGVALSVTYSFATIMARLGEPRENFWSSLFRYGIDLEDFPEFCLTVPVLVLIGVWDLVMWLLTLPKRRRRRASATP